MTERRDTQAHSAIETVARRSYGRLVALLATHTHDVAAAEDALSDAFAAALADWSIHGCPGNPDAWLLTVAKRKAIDMRRRGRANDRVDADIDQIAGVLDIASGDREMSDRRLELMFACAHPDIDPSVRAPLILQVLLGINADRIANAFLTSPSAMAKRLVRAKRQIREAGIPFRIPEHHELQSRLHSVLQAVYAAFTEGWSNPIETDTSREDLSEEAIFLARLTVELLPAEPEAMGLLAIMLYAEARRFARRDKNGDYVPLAEQDSSQWDTQKIEEAEKLLLVAKSCNRIGRYQLEAAIQSAHVDRIRTGIANWKDVLQIYDALFTITSSPVVAINRALTIAEVQGPQAGLDALPDLSHHVNLSAYQPYWAARAQLLSESRAYAEADHAYEIAIGLEADPSIRRHLCSLRVRLPIEPPSDNALSR